MVQSALASKSERSGSTEIGKATTAADERKQRKRLQNRLNQRALRSRNLEKKTTNTKPKQRQFQIDKWRIHEYQALPPARPSLDLGNKPNAVQDTLDPSFKTTWFPLPADHLLHLIKFNVFRGLCENKELLERLAVLIQYPTADPQLETSCNETIYPSYSVIMPVEPHSGCLAPTLTQMNIVHSTWINFIPFPTMRENLIKWEFAFDHSDFVRDLVGDLINLKLFLSASLASRSAVASKMMVVEGDDEEPAGTETGLIVWGEPYREDSWEATPEFLRKWAWAVADCQELIDSTNHWRKVRGEDPVRISAKAIVS